MGPQGSDRAQLPVAARTAVHLETVIAELTDSQIADRIAGFDRMLAKLPTGDDTMRPTVETLRDVLVAELGVREHERDRS